MKGENNMPGNIRKAFDGSVDAATHLTPTDAGAIEAARALADKIDAWDVIVEWANDDAAGVEGKRPAVPANDNTSLPTFLRYCEALALTPSARKGLESGKERTVGKLSKLRAVEGGRKSA